MRPYFVVNPGSANGQTGRRWPELSARIARVVGEYGHGFTTGPMDAARLTRQALMDGYDCIVAVGGDGTINEVVNGYFHEGTCINSQAPLAVLPRGTGGDFLKTFGWDNDMDAALARVTSETSTPLDVGLLHYVRSDGREADRYFVNICSFGVSGLVDQEVNKRSKVLGGKLSFMVASVRALIKYKDAHIRIRADERAPEELNVTTLAVGNGKYFGGGMKVAPDANPSDGLFDVTIWSGYTLADFALKTKAIYDGSHVDLTGTRRFRCKELEAESVDGSEVLLDLDGEQPGRLPCKVMVLPAHLRLKT